MPHVVECPSGLTIEIRKLKTKEANILADTQSTRKGMQFDQMLSGVTENVVDPGPYTLDRDGKLNWGDVLVGDRMYAQLHIRALTFGHDYDFQVPCPSCRESMKKFIDIRDLPVQRLAAEDLERFKASNRFDAVMPWGFTYTFQLLTGKSSRKAAEMVRGSPKSRVTASLLARIVNVTDGAGAEVLHRGKHFDELDLDETQLLIEELDARDCGVDTTISIECDSCGAESGIEVPFDRAGFWASSNKKTKIAS